MSSNPLGEVFGFPSNNISESAERFRNSKLCRFNNKVPSCTKDKANNPLGVCSILENNQPIITCPIRFRENWIIAEDAARFFFKKKASWTSIFEVRLFDKNNNSAGNIDLVLVEYDSSGKIVDFGSVEIQAVYISGNIRNPFEKYLQCTSNEKIEFSLSSSSPPHADFLSSSRKRLAPQLLYKGGILKSWKKKQVVALQTQFFETLPKLKTTTRKKADVAWMLYDLVLDPTSKEYKLTLNKIVYTEFNAAMKQITVAKPGNVIDFVRVLQNKLDEKLEGAPPDAPTLSDISLT